MFMLIASSATNAEAQEDTWFISYKVEELTTNQLVLSWDSETGQTLQNAPLFAGAEYNVSFTLDISLTVPEAVLEMTLNLLHADGIDRFWEVQPENQGLFQDYDPNAQIVRFSHVKGQYTISAFGRVPSDLTTTNLGSGFVIHEPVDLTFIRLIGPDEGLLDRITLNVIDSDIDGYRFILNHKQSELQDYTATQVDPAYIQLYENFVSFAEAQADLGFIDNAVEILEALEVEIPPTKTGPSLQEQYFLPVIGGLGGLMIIFAILFIRTQGRLGFIKMTLEDQIREMEGLQMRASRVDRSLGSRIQEINERLKEAERN